MFRIEHDVETGEIKEIELTAEELKVIEADRESFVAPIVVELTIEEKLESVGLSIPDLKAALGL